MEASVGAIFRKPLRYVRRRESEDASDETEPSHRAQGPRTETAALHMNS
jgi:hypothetical protein